MAENLVKSHKEEQIIQLLNSQRARQFREAYLDLHVYEQAQIFTELNKQQRARLYRYLTANEVGDMFDAIEDELEEVVKYFEEMTPQYAANVIDEMYTDNAVDILAHVPKKDLASYLRLIPQEKAAEIREMLHYEDKTAGAIMSTEYVEILGNQTVRSAMHVVKREASDAETIYYVYVVSAENKLLGVLTLRDLLINADDVMITDIMTTPVMSVKVSDDQAEVAQTIRDYNFLAIPVTDYEGKLIGIINVDDIIDVIDEESAEDYSGLAAVDTEEDSDNPLKAAANRLPWLIVLLLLGMSTTTLISHYEGMISQASILAIFVTSITGTAGNAGTQSLAVAVRRLASRDENQPSVYRQFLIELLTGLVTGLVTGLAIFLIVGFWKQNFLLGFVIGMAMMCAITVANLAGSFIPNLMDKIGVDPAVASGPFISTLSDLTSVLIYFNIAKLFMRFFMGQ